MAATVSIRIPVETHQRLRELAHRKHKSLSETLVEAVDTYEMELMWREAEASYARVRDDPEAWKEWQEETTLWDTTSIDGVPDDDEYAKEHWRHPAAAAG